MSMGSDNFANAPAITLVDSSYASDPTSNVGFTQEPGEQYWGGVNQWMERTAWWKFTPTTSELLTFHTGYSTGPSGTDTLLALYSAVAPYGTANLTGLDFNDDSGGDVSGYGGGTSLIEYEVVAGTTYYIRVGSYYDVDMNYVLSVKGVSTAVPVLTSITPNTGNTGDIIYDVVLLGEGLSTEGFQVVLPSGWNLYNVTPISDTRYEFAIGISGLATDGQYSIGAHNVNGPAIPLTFTVGEPPPASRVLDAPTMDMFLETSSPTITYMAILQKSVPTMEGPALSMHATAPIFIPYHMANAPMLTDIGMDMPPARLGYPGVFRVAVPRFTDMESGLELPTLNRYEVHDVTPLDGATVPLTSDMEFTVTLESTNPNTFIEFQVDDNAGFSSPASAVELAENLDGTVANSVIVSGDYPSGTFMWRYRLIVGGVTTEWSIVRTFMIDAQASSTSYTGTWTIISGTATPVIWFLFPYAGQTGDEVTIYGQGLNKSAATVKVGTITAVIALDGSNVPMKQTIPADTTIPSIIDETSGTVTVEHDEITFIIPDIPAPGASVTVSV